MIYGLKLGWGVAALGLGACTMNNPAFGSETGEASTGTASTGKTSDPSEGSSATVDTQDSTDSSVETTDATDTSVNTTDNTDTSVDTTDTSVDTTDTSVDTTETGGEACMLEGDAGLAFKVMAEAGLPECGEVHYGNYMVSGSNNGNILVQPCEAYCETCSDGLPYELEIHPEDLTDFAAGLTNACINVQLAGFVDGGETYCGYDKAVITVLENGADYPVFIGSSRDGALPDAGVAYLQEAGLSWELVEALTCDCPEDEPCCLPEDVPTLWDFDVGDGPALQPGDIYQISSMTGAWNFIPKQAQYLDSCGANVEVSWMLIAAG